MLDWGDLKYFLATARNGSTLRAARELGVSQTTVARRIDSLEKALSLRLFDRKREGYRLSEAGAAILAQAESVAVDVAEVERHAAAYIRQLSGVVRVATVEDVANDILTPLLAEFMDLYPDIRVELIAKDFDLDLTRAEVAISAHPADYPIPPGNVARKLAQSTWSVFCSRSYAAKHGKPSRGDDLEGHFIVGSEGRLATVGAIAWFANAARKNASRSVCSTLSNTIAAIKNGHGLGVLPLTIAVRHPDLIECFGIPNSSYGFYLLTRESVRDVPRVKAFTEFILARAPALKRMLERGPSAD